MTAWLAMHCLSVRNDGEQPIQDPSAARLAFNFGIDRADELDFAFASYPDALFIHTAVASESGHVFEVKPWSSERRHGLQGKLLVAGKIFVLFSIV